MTTEAAKAVRGRVLVIGIACGVLGVVMAGLLSIPVSRAMILRSAAPLLGWVMQHGELARCEADPATWQLAGPGGPIYAYDAVTLASRNPATPPLADELRAQLAQRDRALMFFGVGRGGTVAVRAPSGGACGVMTSTWPPAISPGALYGFYAAVGLLAGLLGVAIAALASRRPLRALAAAHDELRAHRDELAHKRDELKHQIADVAHDVRTPIASLQLALEQAIDNAGDPAITEESLLRAVHDVVYVGGLIGNLRLASELRAGALDAIATAPLPEIVERAAIRARFLARRKRIALEVAIPDAALAVAGDPIAIAQAVGNVVDNAVAHNAEGGHVAIVLEAHGERFVLSVVDDGPGVEPAELPRLGERTFRSDAARGRDARGQGLGLAITAEVCRRLGWTLAFARESPRGLRVTISGRVISAG